MVEALPQPVCISERALVSWKLPDFIAEDGSPMPGWLMELFPATQEVSGWFNRKYTESCWLLRHSSLDEEQVDELILSYEEGQRAILNHLLECHPK